MKWLLCMIKCTGNTSNAIDLQFLTLSFYSNLSCFFTLAYIELAEIPLPWSIPINLTSENVWLILDSVKSYFEEELTDVMKDSDTEFVVEDDYLDKPTNNQPHAIVNDKIDNNANDQDKFPSQEKKLSKKKYIRRYIRDK